MIRLNLSPEIAEKVLTYTQIDEFNFIFVLKEFMDIPIEIGVIETNYESVYIAESNVEYKKGILSYNISAKGSSILESLSNCIFKIFENGYILSNQLHTIRR